MVKLPALFVIPAGSQKFGLVFCVFARAKPYNNAASVMSIIRGDQVGTKVELTRDFHPDRPKLGKPKPNF